MYSYDLIDRVLNMYKNRKLLGLTVTNIASIMTISKQTIYNWLGGKFKISDKGKRVYERIFREIDHEYINYITKYVIDNPQFNIKTLLKNVITIFNIGISKQTIYNILKRNNITHKVIQINKYPHSKKRFDNEVNILKKQLKKRKSRTISLDEIGIQLDTIRKYGWAYVGKRCIIDKKQLPSTLRFSLLFAISKRKIIKYALKKGSFKGVDFNNYMNDIHVKNGKYSYLLDNARIHHAKIISNDIKKRMIYNVPYSPQFNPIEYVNNELKRQIKNAILCNEHDLRLFLDKFIKTSNKIGFTNYFEKSYSLLGI